MKNSYSFIQCLLVKDYFRKQKFQTSFKSCIEYFFISRHDVQSENYFWIVILNIVIHL